jgi:hypothetical protein
VERFLSNSRVLQDFLDSEIGVVDRLVDEVLARYLPKKPAGRVEAQEELAARA